MSNKPPFPIDVVWTWCGLLNKLKQARILREHPQATGLCACGLDVDMRYSMRSVATHMPWARRAYVVVDDKALLPKWLTRPKGDKRLRIVEHAEIIPAQYLPTYNSNVVDSYLHLLPGLAEHFVVFDQDTYVGRPTRWTDFFASDDHARPSGPRPINRHYPGPSRHRGPTDNLYAQMWLNGIRRFGLDNTRLQHTVQPFTRTLLRRYADKYAAPLARASRHRFRSPTDFNLLRFTTALTSTSGEARMIHTDEHTDYFAESPDRRAVSRVRTLRPQFFCLNNSSPTDAHTYRLLEKMFPEKSEFEAPFEK